MNWIRKYLLFGWVKERKQKRIEEAKRLRKETQQRNNPLGGGENSEDGLPPHIKKVFDILGSGGMGTRKSPIDSFEQDLGDLGEPDEIESFKDGDIEWEKHTWHTPNGSIGKVEIKGGLDGDIPEDLLSQIMSGGSRRKKKSLEEQLEEAVANEDYEKASELRDKIAEEKSEAKNSQKNSDSKNRSNGTDSWNI